MDVRSNRSSGVPARCAGLFVSLFVLVITARAAQPEAALCSEDVKQLESKLQELQRRLALCDAAQKADSGSVAEAVHIKRCSMEDLQMEGVHTHMHD